MLEGGAPASPFEPKTAIRNALLSKYDVLEEIGRGGMAVVYKAIDKNLGRSVALKVLAPQYVRERDTVQRFQREANAVSQMSHNNIVMIYDVGSEGDIHYMAMEYLAGRSLYTLIRERGRLSVQETLRVMTPIADALGYAHAKGVVHRDVKSPNILMRENGDPVLMDFGLAYLVGGPRLSINGEVLGTPGYMSPEQLSGKDIDARTDIFSFGVVLYEALTGSLPFESMNPLVMMARMKSEEPADIRTKQPDVPALVAELVHHCLQNEPARRPQSARELYNRMLECLLASPARSPTKIFENVNKIHPSVDSPDRGIGSSTAAETTRWRPSSDAGRARKRVSKGQPMTRQQEEQVIDALGKFYGVLGVGPTGFEDADKILRDIPAFASVHPLTGEHIDRARRLLRRYRRTYEEIGWLCGEGFQHFTHVETIEDMNREFQLLWTPRIERGEIAECVHITDSSSSFACTVTPQPGPEGSRMVISQDQ